MVSISLLEKPDLPAIREINVVHRFYDAWFLPRTGCPGCADCLSLVAFCLLFHPQHTIQDRFIAHSVVQSFHEKWEGQGPGRAVETCSHSCCSARFRAVSSLDSSSWSSNTSRCACCSNLFCGSWRLKTSNRSDALICSWPVLLLDPGKPLFISPAIWAMDRNRRRCSSERFRAFCRSCSRRSWLSR